MGADQGQQRRVVSLQIILNEIIDQAMQTENSSAKRLSLNVIERLRERLRVGDRRSGMRQTKVTTNPFVTRNTPRKRGDGFRRRGYSSHFYAEYPRNLVEKAIIYTFAAQIRNNDIRNRNNESISD